MIILCFVQINHLKWDGDRRGIGGIPQGGQGGLQPVQRSVLNRSCALENVLVGEREGGEGERERGEGEGERERERERERGREGREGREGGKRDPYH